jgi:glycosyltransferase involved in cell wall biosynthesis
MSYSLSTDSFNSSNPLISVILCVYNGGDLLRDAVNSVLTQTWQNLELIIINDGSTDGCVVSIKDINDPRMKIINQANAGKPTAMNCGLDIARGEFYAIQDADDISHPERLERQVSRLIAEPELAGVFCGFDLILDGRRVAPRLRGKSAAECAEDIKLFRMPGHDPTAMYRVSLVREFRYDTELRVVEGLDHILRVGEKYPLAVCDGSLYSYRIESASLTKQNPRKRIELVRSALRKAYIRRGLPIPDEFGAPIPVNLQRRDIDNNLAAHFMESVVDLCHVGKRIAAVGVGVRCVFLWPWAGHYWKAFLYALLPQIVVTKIRKNRS